MDRGLPKNQASSRAWSRLQEMGWQARPGSSALSSDRSSSRGPAAAEGKGTSRSGDDDPERWLPAAPMRLMFCSKLRLRNSACALIIQH